MAESKTQVVTKVDQLRPGKTGLTLTVKVVDSKLVMQRGRPDGPQGRQMRMAECLVGDETGMIIFTARNDQGKVYADYNMAFNLVSVHAKVYVCSNQGDFANG